MDMDGDKLINTLNKPPTKKFELNMIESKSILDKILNSNIDNVAIFSGAVVDPDGLASAETMRQIIELNGGKSTVFYHGAFNRPQNKTMRQILNLNVKSDEDFNHDDYTLIISIDGPASVCPKHPDFIIDHHEQTVPANIASDIRLIGSCSSILWQYAMEASINFESEDGAKLATALAIGIITDTKIGAEENASELDYEALTFCLKHKDNKAYKTILNFPEPAYYNDYHKIGWENRVEEQGVLVTGLGDIPEARAGVISHLADRFHKMDGNSTSVVFAMVDGNIMASMRTNNSSINTDEFVKKVFGSGGGKKGSAAAIVELPALFKELPDKLRAQIATAVGAAITHKTLQMAGDGVTNKG